MLFAFEKYQGTGNDFVMIDNRTIGWKPTKEQVASICHRRLGIGADGLILLENSDQHAFKMVYFNSDGGESTMCGNGGRCVVAFAKMMDIFEEEVSFEAIDGVHHAWLTPNGVRLQMTDVSNPSRRSSDDFTLNTGSPHFVRKFQETPSVSEIVSTGKHIRYSPEFFDQGINVNLVQVLSENELFVGTYERGVEDITLSCGTGVTAAAIVASYWNQLEDGNHTFNVEVLGGNLSVSYHKAGDSFTQVMLEGPAICTFTGIFSI